MSKLTTPKDLNQPMFEAQDFESNSLLASWDFAGICDDKYTHENKHFSNAQHSKSPETNNCMLSISSNVDDLIQSNISNLDDLSINDNDYTDKKAGHRCMEHSTAGPIHAVKRYPSSSYSSTKSCDVPKDLKPNTSSNTFNFGQILNHKAGIGSLQKRKSYNNDLENVSTFARTSYKNQNHTENLHQTQVKTKLRTMWNNMKYGWRVKREVNLKLDSETWLLGQCYHSKTNDDTALQEVSKELKLDLLSRILLTYRVNFPQIPGTDLISDSGWGCMLRCGQMMMAQALVCHFLTRDWRVSLQQPSEKQSMYKMILRWFGDSLSEDSPFSLHHLVSLGENYGRKAGDWYGPTHAAQVIRDALIQGKIKHPLLQNMCMYVALDGIVFKQDIMDLCSTISTHKVLESHVKEEQMDMETDKNTLICESSYNIQRTVEHWKCQNTSTDLSFTDPCPSYSEFGPPSFNTAQSNWTSLILYVSVRLGNDKINPFYVPCLKHLLSYEHCIGIIGGRPKHALYFIGWQGDKLIHMDPHSCQPAIDVEKDDFNEKSFHSSSIRTMSFTEMDPSCAIGFYFKRKEEFLYFVDNFSKITAPMKRNLDYPVFALAEGKRKDVEHVDMVDTFTRSSLSHATSKTDEDDYILL